MNILGAIGLCMLAAFEVTVSPDQPLPYSYTDDPLIVEVWSDTPCVGQISITATPDYAQEPQKATFDGVVLGPEKSRWCALKHFPTLRGPWAIEVSVTVDGESTVIEETAFRIDRPAEGFYHPVIAYGDGMDRNTLLALRSVMVNTVRVPVNNPDLPEQLNTMRTLGMKAIVALDPDQVSLAALLIGDHCDVISGWTLHAIGDTQAFAEGLQSLRSMACTLPVDVMLPDTAFSSGYLEQAAHVKRCVVTGNPLTLVAFQDVLTTRGLTQISMDATLPEELVQQPERLLPTFFDCITRGADGVAVPVGLLYADGKLQPGLARINGLMHRVPTGRFAGAITQEGSTRARVFASGNRWFVAAWRTDDVSSITLPWSDKHPFILMDQWGNGLENSPGDGNWSHPLPEDFLYISGFGGDVLKTAILNRVRYDVAQALDDKNLKSAWSDSTLATLKAIATNPADISSRIQFFALLRAFPEIEDRWHSGLLTRPVATVALARLATLARTLCQMEAALGTPFLEPLTDTLARCEAFQSAYLTGATTTPQARERGDWLVAEVRRLMDESESLAQVDQRIEADAVAALAEWRARALESAAKAGPQSDLLELPEPEAPPEEPVKAPEPPKKSKGKKK